MGRPADPRRDEAVRTIRELTQKHGVAEGVRLAREQFSDVPPGSWGRWRAQAVGSVREQHKIDDEAVDALASDLLHQIPPPEELVCKVEDAVPATRRALDFWKMLAELDEDAQLMRNFAVKVDADGNRRVRVPRALHDAHRMRCDLIRMALQHSATAWSVERMRGFYDVIIAEIGAESPDMQRRVLGRLRKLNADVQFQGL